MKLIKKIVAVALLSIHTSFGFGNAIVTNNQTHHIAIEDALLQRYEHQIQAAVFFNINSNIFVDKLNKIVSLNQPEYRQALANGPLKFVILHEILSERNNDRPAALERYGKEWSLDLATLSGLYTAMVKLWPKKKEKENATPFEYPEYNTQFVMPIAGDSGWWCDFSGSVNRVIMEDSSEYDTHKDHDVFVMLPQQSSDQDNLGIAKTNHQQLTDLAYFISQVQKPYLFKHTQRPERQFDLKDRSFIKMEYVP